MKRRRTFSTLANFCLYLMLATSALAQEVELKAPQTKITNASAVRARTGPQVAAQEVMRVKLGTVLSAVARSADESEIGGKRDYWYRVKLPSGETAWVFGGLLADYDPARREEIFRRIIEERLKVEGLSFEDGMDLYSFVSDSLAGAVETSAKAEFELLRVLALSRSVMSIPFEERERPPYRDWYKAHEPELVYSEPSGSWLVRSEVLWSLERKYRGTPVAERIAWEAAQNPLPGECEGDEVCYFLYLSDTEGRYLSLYPNGPHAGEVLRNFEQALASADLKSLLGNKSGDVYAAEQRAELRKALAELRTTLPKTSGTQKATLLRTLDRLAPVGR